MGQLCSRICSRNQSSALESENEISIPSYKSKPDNEYLLLENKYNYFRDIKFTDYMHSLVNFSIDNATLDDNYSEMTLNYSFKDKFYNAEFTSDLFQSFIENKMFKHIAIKERAAKNEVITSMFKDFAIASFGGLALKMVQNDKLKHENEEGYNPPDKNSILKKKDLISFGVLFCFSNVSKIHIIFNLFKDGDTIKKSDELSDFILSVIILASYGLANARNKCSKYEEIGSIEIEKLKEFINCSELQDCLKMTEITNRKLFGIEMKDKLNYEQFKSKFMKTEGENSLGYLLNPSGVRYMLEQNNID